MNNPSNTQHVSFSNSPSGVAALNWGSSQPRKHLVKFASNPSSRGVRIVLQVDGQEFASARAGTVGKRHHEAPGGAATRYEVRLLDDNDEIVPEPVSLELSEVQELQK